MDFIVESLRYATYISGAIAGAILAFYAFLFMVRVAAAAFVSARTEMQSQPVFTVFCIFASVFSFSYGALLIFQLG